MAQTRLARCLVSGLPREARARQLSDTEQRLSLLPSPRLPTGRSHRNGSHRPCHTPSSPQPRRTLDQSRHFPSPTTAAAPQHPGMPQNAPSRLAPTPQHTPSQCPKAPARPTPPHPDPTVQGSGPTTAAPHLGQAPPGPRPRARATDGRVRGRRQAGPGGQGPTPCQEGAETDPAPPPPGERQRSRLLSFATPEPGEPEARRRRATPTSPGVAGTAAAQPGGSRCRDRARSWGTAMRQRDRPGAWQAPPDQPPAVSGHF